MLLLPKGQMGEAWEPPKKEVSLENRVALDRRVLPLSPYRVSGVKRFQCGLNYLHCNLHGPVKIQIKVTTERCGAMVL
jgi:hypothetical protein